MKIIAKIFNCNYETYKLVYVDAIKKAFLKDNIVISEDNIKVEIDELPGDTIQAQRSPNGRHSRTITVLVDEKPKYIIGFSNTGFDEDRKIESEKGIRDYNYGNNDYHSNSYICQGINKIFDLYYDNKKIYPNIKLYFYLLDIDKKSYPHSLSNIISYRELYTVGFEILNIDRISFEEFKQLGFSTEENTNYEYTSFNKFSNDLIAISNKNHANFPAYIKCIDHKFNIETDNDKNDYGVIKDLTELEYIYTFKTLGAQSYDNFLIMWTLNTLAKKENKKLKFEFSKEKYNFRLEQPAEDAKYTEDFPSTIINLFEKIGVDIQYESSEEVRQQLNRQLVQYTIAKRRNDIRNQELFKNNLRAKGIETKCYLCGCEVEEILEAAHLWGVSEIKNSDNYKINTVLNKECMKDLMDYNQDHSNETFYKKYVLANSGDNGVWLCSNHHNLFDRNFYCFDSEFGKVIIKNNCGIIIDSYIKSSKFNQLPKNVLTDKTKVFLTERKNIFDLLNQNN
jgi:hypothetical protein